MHGADAFSLATVKEAVMIIKVKILFNVRLLGVVWVRARARDLGLIYLFLRFTILLYGQHG